MAQSAVDPPSCFHLSLSSLGRVGSGLMLAAGQCVTERFVSLSARQTLKVVGPTREMT